MHSTYIQHINTITSHCTPKNVENGQELKITKAWPVACGQWFPKARASIIVSYYPCTFDTDFTFTQCHLMLFPIIVRSVWNQTKKKKKESKMRLMENREKERERKLVKELCR